MGTGTGTGITRSSLAAATGLLVLAADAACTSGRCIAPPPEPDVLAPSEVEQVADEAANVLLDLSGALPDAVRVTATFDEAVALDVEVPASSAVCASDAITRYGYLLPPGPVTVEVAAGDGRQESVSLVVGDRPQWVVVGLQEGFPLRVDLWQERPQYG